MKNFLLRTVIECAIINVVMETMLNVEKNYFCGGHYVV